MTKDIAQKEASPSGKPEQGRADARVTRMGTASIPALITEFAIPAIAGMLVNGAYNLIDSVFLGQAMGELGLSAITVATPTMTVFMALSMLVGAGGNALCALRFGEGRHRDAEISLGNTVTLSIVLAVIVAICAAIPPVLDGLLTVSSAEDSVRPYAAAFIRIICFGFIFQCIGMGVNNFIRTAGAPNRALVTMVIGAVTCTIFNALFVLGLGWGVVGSALANVCGQVVSCIAVLWYFIFTKNVPLKLRLSCMRPHGRVIRSIVSLGMASFVVQAGAAVLSFATNAQLNVYGAASPLGVVDAFASIGVVQRIAMFTILPLIGMSIAIQPLLGFNYGARLISRVRKTLWCGIAAATVIAVIMWAVVHLFPEAIVNLFGITDSGLVDFTVFALKVQLMMLPFIGFQIVGSNYFQATGQPTKSIILSLTRQILFLLPLLYAMPIFLPQWFPQYTGLDALYFVAPVSDGLAIFMVGVFIFFEMKRLKKMEQGTDARRTLDKAAPEK